MVHTIEREESPLSKIMDDLRSPRFFETEGLREVSVTISGDCTSSHPMRSRLTSVAGHEMGIAPLSTYVVESILNLVSPEYIITHTSSKPTTNSINEGGYLTMTPSSSVNPPTKNLLPPKLQRTGQILIPILTKSNIKPLRPCKQPPPRTRDSLYLQ
jgi:hypothetical protein